MSELGFLFWLPLVLVLYAVAEKLYIVSGKRFWLYPVIMPTVLLVLFLYWYDIPVDMFSFYTMPLQYLLLAATVALALPLYKNRHVLREQFTLVITAIIAGSVAGAGSAAACAFLLQAPHDIAMSLTTKSVTTPIAVELMPYVGGIPSIAAVVVVTTGLVVAAAGPAFLRHWGIDDEVAVGLSFGTAGHGLGMAEAVRRSDIAGAAAAVAMVVNGLLTAVFLGFLGSL